MHYKRFAPVLLALGLSASANAAVSPLKLPTVNGYAVELPGVKSLTLPLSMPGVTVSAQMAAPSVSAKIAVPTLTPTVIAMTPISAASASDLPKPVALGAKTPAPSAGDHFTLDWSLLDGKSGGSSDKDGEEHSGELVPVDPGPKPMPPAGAHAQLRDASADRKPIRMAAEKMFDGRRETIREEALPHAKIF